MNRRATSTRCRCGVDILTGLDGDRAALLVAVDNSPITAQAEVTALTGRRRTYELRLGALDLRNRWTIPGRPPSPSRPVLVEHDCNQPVPRTWLLPPDPIPAPPILVDQEVPF